MEKHTTHTLPSILFSRRSLEDGERRERERRRKEKERRRNEIVVAIVIIGTAVRHENLNSERGSEPVNEEGGAHVAYIIISLYAIYHIYILYIHT